MKTSAFVAGVVACCLVTCRADDGAAKPQAEVLPQTTNGNFVLYVSNQSAAMSPVDITIQIDGKTAVATEFVFGEGPAGGHKVVHHAFQLAPGKHKITAVSQKGGVRMEGEIEIKDKHWAYLTYRFQKDGEPKRFTFGIQDGPMVFG